MAERLDLDDVPAGFGKVVAAMRDDAMPNGRGWLLMGGTGTGKTARARLASEVSGTALVSADEVVSMYVDEGGGTAALLAAARLGLGRHERRYPACDLIIDDLGRERPESRVFGERVDVMREVLERRLDAWPHLRTYATTNLSEGQLLERYGERAVSRMRQAMAFYEMPAGDYRDPSWARPWRGRLTVPPRASEAAPDLSDPSAYTRSNRSLRVPRDLAAWYFSQHAPSGATAEEARAFDDALWESILDEMARRHGVARR